MKESAKILAYLVGVLLLGALLAPLVFWTARALEPWALANGLEQWDPRENRVVVNGALQFLTTNLQSCFQVALLLAAALLLLPGRLVGIGGTAGVPLEPDPRKWSHLWRGFAICAALFIVLEVILALNFARLQSSPAWGGLPGILLIAMVVATLEEIVFRGAILGLLLGAFPRFQALFWSGIVFAILQTFGTGPEAQVARITWTSGFELLPVLAKQFALPATWLGFASALFLGWLPGYARLRTGALWLSIGLTAGALFAAMSYSALTVRDSASWPWVGRGLLEGILPVALLLLAGLFVKLRLDHEEFLPQSGSRD